MNPTEELLQEFVHESNLIEGIDGMVADKDYYQAMLILLAEPKKLTNMLICKIQRLITAHQTDLQPIEKGYYRSHAKINVHVGGMVAPAWHMIEFLMDNWLLDYGDASREIDPIKAHINFEHIHPFCDGNGRTGRALLQWHLARQGQPIRVIPSKTKHEEYYTWF